MSPWYKQRFAPVPGTMLCSTHEIATGKVKEFRFGGDSPFAFRMFIYNDKGEYKAYRNACPHFEVPLNHTTEQLNKMDKRHFVCMTHFARFKKESGLCVAGPCEGEALETIPLQQEGDRLLVGEGTE